MYTRNILFTLVILALGTFSTLSAQSDCKEKVKEVLEQKEANRTDTTVVVDPETYEQTTSITKVYLPGAPKEYDLVEEEGNMKVYYVNQDNCLMIRHIEMMNVKREDQ